MTVRAVSVDAAHAAFTHRDNAVLVQLPRRFAKGERLRLRIAYAGVPASGLRIVPNKHGERTFFSGAVAHARRTCAPRWHVAIPP